MNREVLSPEYRYTFKIEVKRLLSMGCWEALYEDDEGSLSTKANTEKEAVKRLLSAIIDRRFGE